MDSDFTVTLPKLGESILSATVVQWFKKAGDAVRLDEPLLEVSTDKVNSEIPSPVEGVLAKILAQPDTELQVGEALCVIASKESKNFNEQAPALAVAETQAEPQGSMKRYFSPVVLKIAEQENIPLDVLQRVPATGVGGRVSKRDLEKFLEQAASKPSKNSCPLQTESSTERVKMTGLRKSIADNMVKSFYEAPHATLINEVDVTPIMKLIKKRREEILKTHGFKLTITAFLAKAIIKAVQEYPFINASLDNDTILLKRFVNLGIAVSVDQGVMVPVIKHCHQKSVLEIAEYIHALSEKTREGSLSPNDVKDGTITLTNFGMTGTLIGVPIIRYPEVAIIGAGAIHKKVSAMEDDSIAIRQVMHLSLTFDHRVLDGMYGCGFLKAVKKHLEEIAAQDSL